ncbi:hypothetical protein F7725_012074 [Dissostichus mawsoni]|uniref:inositol-phosphate phosphatase n=1 Tax=Dissostichus mawsoni TaxID=36200 RepID=A0A7J5ZBD4_DISMA|nr:hypothetical protein F7725_012074 [Dissostichus mawsoni]
MVVRGYFTRTMSPMGIRLSPLGLGLFCLLGVGVIYHLQRRTVDLRDLLAVSVEAALLGGTEVKTLYFHSSINRTWSRKIPADILEKVEGGRDVPAESVTVWIDPLDATQEYTENLVKFVTTMVCVAVDGKPVIGVIHVPFTGFTAWAFVGQGSNMRARSSYSVSTPKAIVSRSHSGKVKRYKVLSLLEMPSSETIPMDQADVYIHVTFIKKWDICAGGHMTTLKGEDIDYSGTALNKGGLVASVGVDHKALVKKLPDQGLCYPFTSTVIPQQSAQLSQTSVSCVFKLI